MARKTAGKLFISAVPRPNTRSFLRTVEKGSVAQSCPSTGTTSVCAERTHPPFVLGPTLASKLALFPWALYTR